MGALMEKLIGPDLAFKDASATKEVLSSLDNEKQVLFVVVFDEAGKRFAERGSVRDDLLFGSHGGHDKESLDSKGSVLIASFPIANGAKYLGQMVLGIDLAPVTAAAASGVKAVVLLSLVCVLVFGVLTAFTARRVVARVRVTADLMREFSLGSGDLTQRLDAQGEDEIAALAASFNAFVENIHDLVASMRRSAEGTAAAAKQVHRTADSIAQGTQRQAATLEETAANIDQIAAMATQNADSAQKASELAGTARQLADRGSQVAGETATAIREVRTTSNRIAEISAVIDEIAFRTNLLAINAAVEAARAGEQGRGFAVVAAEVGNLSNRSSEAAKEIKTLILDALKAVDGGVSLVNESGQALKQIQGSVTRQTQVASEISTQSRAQSSEILQVAQAVKDIDEVTQRSAIETQQLVATAGSLLEQASALLARVSDFTLAPGSLVQSNVPSSVQPVRRPQVSTPGSAHTRLT